MEEFTFNQKLKIRDYFDDPNYPQPHGEVMATQLLAAMIASGRYGLEEYPRLVEAAIRLTGVCVTRFNAHMGELRELRDDNNPKPSASENDLNSNPNSEAYYNPIPF
ncbi:hypothetical protein [Microcoleus sp. K5-D4]|uniref:hypothetical protein n=1 Tax=Microcoleus sp. K5-D4 TaxID=2818801 RepID=UPI002FD7594B